MEQPKPKLGFGCRQFDRMVHVVYDGELVGDMDGMAAMLLGEALINAGLRIGRQGQSTTPLTQLERQQFGGIDVRIDEIAPHGLLVIVEMKSGEKHTALPAVSAKTLGEVINRCGVRAWECDPANSPEAQMAGVVERMEEYKRLYRD